MDLGLDDPDRTAEFLGGLNRLLDGEGRHAPWDRHAELAQDFLGLVFVDFHERTFTESVDTADRERIAADC
jgi:hypothetical protein